MDYDEWAESKYTNDLQDKLEELKKKRDFWKQTALTMGYSAQSPSSLETFDLLGRSARLEKMEQLCEKLYEALYKIKKESGVAGYDSGHLGIHEISSQALIEFERGRNE